MKSRAQRLTTTLFAAALMAGAASSAYAAGGTIEVMHWWTSGGEAKSLQVLKEQFEKAGGKWIDSPVAGGGGAAAITVLRSRVLAGDPPGAFQLKGPQIKEWTDEGALADVDAVAQKEGWDKLVPPQLQSVVKVGGKYYGVPVNIHRVDWIWANPEALKKVGAQPPKTWDEFNAVADKLKAAGITPLAHGGQPWQDFTLFEIVALGLGGPEYFKKAFIDRDQAALKSDTTVKVFDQMRKLRGYVDSNFSGRDWNLATAMVMKGEAGMQIMGDWAKGEFAAAGKVAGKDYLCVPAPTNGGYILNSDSFAMFKQKDAAKTEGVGTLATQIMSPSFQEAFNLNKGSIPARLDVSMDKFDECAKKSNADLKASIDSGKLVPSLAHGMAVTGAVAGAISDVVTEHFNSSMASKEAADKLAEAVAQAL